MSTDEDNRTYTVVMNHEEQYSIWPANKDIPVGWKQVGKSGSKQECLAHVKAVWTDMRPLSLRKQGGPHATEGPAHGLSAKAGAPR